MVNYIVVENSETNRIVTEKNLKSYYDFILK